MTTKKAPAKAVKPAQKATAPAKRAKTSVAQKNASEPTYSMPAEVKDWIERAQSIMNHQKGEIERLKKENTELKSYKKWAEHRILRSDHE